MLLLCETKLAGLDKKTFEKLLFWQKTKYISILIILDNNIPESNTHSLKNTTVRYTIIR